MRRRKVRHVVAVLVAALSMAAGHGTNSVANETNFAEGSDGDIGNVQRAAESDALNVSTAPAVFGVPYGGGGGVSDAAARYCQGFFTQPSGMYDNFSPTRMRVELYYEIQCYGYNYVDVTFYLERSRWYGWQTLASENVNESGHNDRFEGYVETPCRAGTWSYRARSSGYAYGSTRQDANAISKSTRLKCVKGGDVDYIDYG